MICLFQFSGTSFTLLHLNTRLHRWQTIDEQVASSQLSSLQLHFHFPGYLLSFQIKTQLIQFILICNIRFKINIANYCINTKSSRLFSKFCDNFLSDVGKWVKKTSASDEERRLASWKIAWSCVLNISGIKVELYLESSQQVKTIFLWWKLLLKSNKIFS